MENDQSLAPEVNQEEELKKKIVLYYHQLVSLIPFDLKITFLYSSKGLCRNGLC